VRIRPVLAATAAALVAAALAACGPSGAPAAPTWTPVPSFSRDGLLPGDPEGGDPGAPRLPAPRPSNRPSPSPSRTGGRKIDPNVVATHLVAPTGIAVLPDGTALVGERTTGRIVRVQPRPNRPVPTVRVIPGLSTVGGGGLLDLALSPNYAEDQLIFAYVTTAHDNRVITFTLHGPITPVVTGIPRGRSGNTGHIAFAANGDLLVATGDAGNPRLAADPKSLAGKILRITDIGRPAPHNPQRGSPIYASGVEAASALCVDLQSELQVLAEARGPASSDPVYSLEPDATYGWPLPAITDPPPLGTLPDASRSPGGCAIADGILYVTSLDGEALLTARAHELANAPVLGAWQTLLRHRYGRLLTVVAAPDGALWLTTSNRDGHGTPVPADERVLRIVPSGGGDKGATT
jgi:glucose/arabinose dehydrogenase